jgi:hypothetical protein
MPRERGLTYFPGSADDHVSGRFSGVANLIGSRFVMIDAKALLPLFLTQGLCGATTVVPPNDACAMEDRPAEL